MKDLLLQVNEKYYDYESKTNKVYEFSVEKDYDFIEINFHYSPKIFDDIVKKRKFIKKALNKAGVYDYEGIDTIDLMNLITLSADDPKGFRGAAHKHAPTQKIIVSETDFTYGFLNRQLFLGLWKVVISVFCVISEFIDVEITIYGKWKQDENKKD